MVCCAIFSPSLGYAAESISFIDKNEVDKQQIPSSLSKRNFNQLAEVDLNNDSVAEYILLRDADDSSHAFEVLAMINNRLIPLAKIRAQKLMIAYDENNGVRSILGFKDANNDYEYDIYSWDAMRSKYSNRTSMREVIDTGADTE